MSQIVFTFAKVFFNFNQSNETIQELNSNFFFILCNLFVMLYSQDKSNTHRNNDKVNSLVDSIKDGDSQSKVYLVILHTFKTIKKCLVVL